MRRKGFAWRHDLPNPPRRPALPVRPITLRLALVLALTIPTAMLHAQNTAAAFPAAAFDSVARVAEWLARYDQVAWETSALVTARVPHLAPEQVDRIGAEWFCYERDSAWHAVYGRYDAARERYEVVLHYMGRPGGGFTESTTRPDSLLAARYGRALWMTRSRLPADVRDEGVQLTTSVRARPDGTLDVWYLPAFQPDGWAVYGVELRYRVDSMARKVVDSTAVIGTLRGSLLDSTVTIDIDNTRNAMPTVGQAFFATLYASRFAAIVIENRDFVSELVPGDRGRVWRHDRKDGVNPP